MAESKNVPTTATQERSIQYIAADGQEMKLTLDMVKKYLVQGKGELITVQEAMFFLNICKSRRLNPLIKDCYLVKYSNDPAAIVTSIDYFRKRARAQKDCKGWKKGVIVQDKEGKTRDSYGLVLDGEKLVGGWFEATPEGWLNPFRLEVNLSGYIKKKSDGGITQFWKEENQPSQIAKVAESQGLRTVWPDEFQQLYTEDEIGPGDFEKSGAIEIGGEDPQIPTPEQITEAFNKSIPKGADPELLKTFLQKTADSNKVDVDQVMAEALKSPKDFWKMFGAWVNMEKKKAASKQESVAEEMAPGECPNVPGTTYKKSVCDKCQERAGCPTWDKA